MKATELKSVLANLSDLLRAGGAKQSAADVALLSERLNASGDQLATAAIEELEKELCTAAPVQLTTQRYISDLQNAALDETAFDRIYAKLCSDRSIKKADAVLIMKGYAGKHARARTKADALDEIQRQFTKLLYDANTDKQATSTPW